MDERLPAHVEVTALVRSVNAAGGFAAVLHKGEREAGVVLVVCCENGGNARLYERMPTVEGGREWTCTRTEDIENLEQFRDYLDRRVAQDRDSWIVELDIANGERFIGLKASGT